jgi:hypothetical protein
MVGLVDFPPNDDFLPAFDPAEFVRVFRAFTQHVTALQTKSFGVHEVPTALCLIHSEISEALEGYRKDLLDTHLPHRTNFEVELADALIRITALGGQRGLDVGGAAIEKDAYNRTRYDHTPEGRAAKNGKRF